MIGIIMSARNLRERERTECPSVMYRQVLKYELNTLY